MACYNFAARYKFAGDCAACGRLELLKIGYCRLCWCQAYLDRPTGPNTPLAPYLAQVRTHQLFLADLNRRRAAPKASPAALAPRADRSRRRLRRRSGRVSPGCSARCSRM